MSLQVLQIRYCKDIILTNLDLPPSSQDDIRPLQTDIRLHRMDLIRADLAFPNLFMHNPPTRVLNNLYTSFPSTGSSKSPKTPNHHSPPPRFSSKSSHLRSHISPFSHNFQIDVQEDIPLRKLENEISRIPIRWEICVVEIKSESQASQEFSVGGAQRRLRWSRYQMRWRYGLELNGAASLCLIFGLMSSE